MLKLLIGGSPCTHWSIAQKNNRETKPEGIGWELFENYLIAKEKFKPDLFLYENNKSAAQAIKDQIAFELGVGTDPMARFTYINSALVSAQNRQRFYVTNFGDIEQPRDRGILLKDVLGSGENLTSKDKSFTLTASYNGAVPWNTIERSQRNMVAEPVRIGTYPNNAKNQKHDSKQYRIYSIDGKSTALCGNGGGMGAKTGLYAIPVEFADGIPTKAVSCADGKTYPVYEVRNGQITIKDKQYPIKLIDGYYIIRKMTVTECCRLQTLPDDYCKAVSATQAYKGLGNGWTAEVIIHLLNHALKDVPKDEEIVVLSMYDGIGTGRYCLDKMGFTNVRYYAYEIDKYAMTVANDNYPDIIQCGDAFAVRSKDWKLEV
ncbi:MAG: DNA cytosine methyltransferase [Faecalibacterium sp.]|nr:DNA cytosine methyltransferase [Ruminococcus sp.]MCM1392183.1 DNA cytosine methyltransferase [Ruminococcus sp.]MCM1486013.1 DNA cytosine methyltransferase [Faecalibacterium sp.]